MRMHPPARLLSCTAALVLTLASSTVAAADPKFAVAQFDNGHGFKLAAIVQFQAADCEKLISTIEASLKLDCPACRRDYGGCTTDLGAYRAVWMNQKFPFPYLSSGRHRWVYSGVARSEAEALCVSSAERHREAGVEAKCVK